MRNFVALTFSIALTSFSIHKTNAQMTDKDVTGEYYLEGVMEVGSGILLKEDHTFQMFFTYGALDKSGEGTWKRNGDSVILDSGVRPASDFKLASSKKKGSGTTVRIVDSNPNILGHGTAKVIKGDSEETEDSDKDGFIHFKTEKVDSIGIFHRMFSDRPCFFDVSKSEDNYFEFTIEKWILNIYCENLVLTIHDGYLEGKHPLLDPEKDYTYKKSQ